MINNILRPITFGWKYCKINLILEDMSHLTLVTPNSAKSNIPYKLVRRICTIVENSDVRKNHLEESRKLYVLVISRTRFRVNPHSIVALTSRNSLLEAGIRLRTKWFCVRVQLQSLKHGKVLCSQKYLQSLIQEAIEKATSIPLKI